MTQLSIETLIRSRHSLHMERLRRLNERANAGEENTGPASIEDEAEACVAIIRELEHLSDVRH